MEKRSRVPVACVLCKQRRKKCSGYPPCDLCTKCGVPCVFPSAMPFTEAHQTPTSAAAKMHHETPAPQTIQPRNSALEYVKLYYKCMQEELPLVTNASMQAVLLVADSIDEVHEPHHDSREAVIAPEMLREGAHPEELFMRRIVMTSDIVPFVLPSVSAIDSDVDGYAAKLLCNAMAAAGAMFVLDLAGLNKYYTQAIALLGGCFARPHASVVSALAILVLLTSVTSSDSRQLQYMLDHAQRMLDSGDVTATPEIGFAFKLLSCMFSPALPRHHANATAEDDAMSLTESASQPVSHTRVSWACARVVRGFYLDYKHLEAAEALEKELSLVRALEKLEASPDTHISKTVRVLPLRAFRGLLLLRQGQVKEAIAPLREYVMLQDLIVAERRWASVLHRLANICSATANDEVVDTDLAAALRDVSKRAQALVLWPVAVGGASPTADAPAAVEHAQQPILPFSVYDSMVFDTSWLPPLSATGDLDYFNAFLENGSVANAADDSGDDMPHAKRARLENDAVL